MPELTQKRFAGLLKAGMKATDMSAAEISRATASDGGKAPINPTTIADYQKPDYPHGPPKKETRERLERAMRLPDGFLSGRVPMDPEQWHSRRLQIAAERQIVYSPSLDPSGFGREPVSDEEEGWLWGDPVLAEEQMRRVLRRYEETSLSMVGNSDLFTRDEMQRDQLGLIALAIRQHVLRGKQIPAWLMKVRQEVFDGTFR